MKRITSIILSMIIMLSALCISATAYTANTTTDDPSVIYFDANTVGWGSFEKLYCSVRKDGKLVYPLYSEETLCSDADNDGIWEYDLSQIENTLENCYPLTLKFYTENNNSTSNLTMDESNINDTVLSLSKSPSGIPVIIWSKNQTLNNAVKIYENKTGEKVETTRYYFLMPNGSNGDKGDEGYFETYQKFASSWYNEESQSAGIYLWNSGIFENDWPGYKMTQDYEKDVYYADVPKCAEAVIFNNFVRPSDDPNDPVNPNLMQTINLYNSGYAPGDSDAYPDGLESFDNMIYVIDPDPVVLSGPYVPEYIKGGEWYFYYGNGCYGTTKDGNYRDCIRKDHNHDLNPHQSTTSVEDVINQYEEESGEKLNTHRYYFMMPDGTNGNTGNDYKKGEFAPSWYNEYTDNAAVYWWGTNIAYDPNEFPGYTMEKGDTSTVFYADIPDEVTTLIFNNNVNFSYREEDLFYKYNLQTINIPCEYYDAGESENYPDGTDSFDNMIFVLQPREVFTPVLPSDSNASVGEWYYYYGNGCYGTVKNGNSSNCIHPSHFDENNNHIAGEYILGDADDDTVLSVMDATHIQMVVANLKALDSFKAEFIADIDKDKVVSVMDATHIQLTLARLN